MAIPFEGTFAYIARIDASCLETRDRALRGQGEVILSARDERGENKVSLCGPNVRLVLIEDRFSIVANDRRNACAWKATFLAGDAVLRHAETGDAMHIAMSCMRGIGISLVRDGKLVLAVGAPVVPLGDVAVRREPDTILIERLEKSELAGGERQGCFVSRDQVGAIVNEPYVSAHGVRERFVVGGEFRDLRPRESADIGPYHVYVERCGSGSPDDAGSIVAMSRGGTSELRNAAMRSAILLGNGYLKVTGWEFFS